ncbi:hypothetical protein O6H91_07G125500 [Diphasiastrum complanatum]|nr:hypothetical protein O6H91_07G125500 [Diphasiastrum complanatum]
MDPAIGSGLVVTLPRIMEDGGPVQKHMGKSSIIEQVADSRDPIPPAITLHRSADVSGKNFSTTNFLPNHGNDSVDQVVTSLENHSTSVNETNLTDAFATDGDSMGEQAGGIKREKHGTRTSGYKESKIPEIGPLDKRIVQWELLLHQIGLDVVRTDRMLQFYEDPKNLAKLWDVLAVYAWFDEDVGYCQGMSDLCSAMVVLFPDEADAFWCFERLMLRVRENFRCNGPVLGVLKQLAVLGSVIEVVDSRLHRHLEALGGGTYMFALRMLMVLFRREFSFSDTLYLWEMMWASEFDAHTHASQGEQNYRVTLKVVKQEPRSEAAWRRGKAYSSNGKFVRRTIKYGSSKLDKESTPLAVFCAAGILEMNQRKLLKGTQGLDEVVKLLNDTTGKLDAGQACKKALKLYKVYLIKLASQ